MNLLELEIDGFGVWSGLKLDDLSQRLTAFYGPNEAGKTTLLQFVRTVLYGFSSERRRRYLPPLHGGRAGGTLTVECALGRFALARHADLSPRTPPAGELRIVDAAGAPQKEHLLDRLLGRVDEATFNNVFAVGLREIQELGSLGDTAAAELLYGLSTGLDRVSLVDVLRELKTSRERLLSTDGKPCQIAALMAEREKIAGEIDELRSISHRYAGLVHQRGELDAEIKRRDQERAEREQAVRVVEAALAVRDSWSRRAELQTRLEQMQARPSISPILVEQIESIGARLAQRRAKLDALQQERKAVRREIAALGLNRALARCAPRIEALAEQETWIGALEAQVDQLSGEVAAVETQLGEDRRRLGVDKDRRAPAIDERTRAVLRPLAKALREPRAKLAAAERQRAANQQTADEAAARIRKALAGRPEKELAPALERAGALTSQLRRRAQLDERLSQMGAQDAALVEQSEKLEDRQLLPGFVLAGLIAVFCLGMAMTLWGGVKLIASGGQGGEGTLVFGLMFCGAAAASKFLLERSAAEQLEATKGQSAALVGQIKLAKEERAALDAQLPRGAGPWLVRLQAAEKELAELEDLLAIDGERQTAQREADAAAKQMQATEEEIKLARRRWRNALGAAGLPKNLSPKEVRHLSERRMEMHASERRLKQARLDLAERRKEFDVLAGRVAQVMADAEIEPASPRATDRLKQLRQALADHQGIASRREALDVRLRRIGRRRTRLAHGIDRWDHRRQVLFVQAGVADEDEFRRRQEDAESLESVRAEHAALSREIAAALGVRLSEEQVGAWLEGPHAGRLEAQREESAADLQAAAERANALFEERGRVLAELKSLADDRRLPQRYVDLGVVEERLREAIEEWQVVAVTGLVLDQVRKQYETERQPETLQEASKHFQRLTDGHYTRVWTPMGENVLLVDDAEGRRLPVETLSRGTREQLFLSLRLALVASYARRGIELPLVLDDVLVNFDSRRAKAAASVLRDFAAEGHQLLVFTCHEHVWKLFKNLKLPARTLPANDDAELATLAYQAPETELADDDLALEPVARWQADDAEDGTILVDEDDFEDEEFDDGEFGDGEEGDSGRRAPFVWEGLENDEREEGELDDDPIDEEEEREAEVAEHDDAEPDDASPRQPPQVTVVRGRMRGGPFDNALWFEPVEDDLDDEEDEDDDEPRSRGDSAEDDAEDSSDDEEVDEDAGAEVEEDSLADDASEEPDDDWDDSGDDEEDDDVEAA